jgi:Fe2+ transport system protein FeoA
MASVSDLVLPLAMLAQGEKGVVTDVVGQPEVVVRLEELGLRVGQAVEVVQAGSPCIVRVSGHKLCFREGEACGVLVRVESGA